MQPTQTRYPWRATARTIAAALVAALVIAPQIITEAGLDETVYGAQALAVIGVVTRILAIPGVEAWMRRWVPWLAAEPADVPQIAVNAVGGGTVRWRDSAGRIQQVTYPEGVTPEQVLREIEDREKRARP